MRWFIPYLYVLMLMLLVALIGLISRIVPIAWRIRLFAVAAFLITTLPAVAETDTGPTCYDMALPINSNAIIKKSEAWAGYRAAYMTVLQYLLNSSASHNNASFNQSTFDPLFQTLLKTENNLNAYILENMLSEKLTSTITEGIRSYIDDYQREVRGITCYEPAMTPEVTRHLALSNIVARQVEIQKLISEKADVTQQTLDVIKADIRSSISKYLDKEDVTYYMDLMMDLINYTPRTSKSYCYK